MVSMRRNFGIVETFIQALMFINYCSHAVGGIVDCMHDCAVFTLLHCRFRHKLVSYLCIK